jgi:hypothetical protein
MFLFAKTGIVQLGESHTNKVLQVYDCTLKFPNSPLFGFSCLVMVLAPNVAIDSNNQTIISCLNGSTCSIGTRLEIRCDGTTWYIFSNYSKTQPMANTIGLVGLAIGVNSRDEITDVTLNPVIDNLLSPITQKKFKISLGPATNSKGKIFKIVIGQDNNLLNFFAVDNFAGISGNVSKLKSNGFSAFNDSGDFILFVSNGLKWFACGYLFQEFSGGNPTQPPSVGG